MFRGRREALTPLLTSFSLDRCLTLILVLDLLTSSRSRRGHLHGPFGSSPTHVVYPGTDPTTQGGRTVVAVPSIMLNRDTVRNPDVVRPPRPHLRCQILTSVLGRLTRLPTPSKLDLFD